MAIRLPLTTVLDYNDSGNVGAGSVAGVVAKTFTLPQDTDGVVVKLTSSLVGATVSATLQTSDDGGTTWFDIARTPTVGVANNANANWISAPVFGMGIRSNASGASSTASGTTQVSVLSATGSSASSSLGVGQVSGLPILSPQGRVALIYTGNITTNDSTRIVVMVSSQSTAGR